jgi:hypothetical protein
MEYHNVEIEKGFPIGRSNGSTLISQVQSGEGTFFIAVESVSMLSGEPLLRDAPSQRNHTDVISSLNRSIEKNADVWRELSKY